MTVSSARTSDAGLHRARLFRGSCVALVATSVAFATVGAIMGALKAEFVLTNAQVGWIGGAALWGFAVSQLVFAPLCDTLGMRFLLRTAFVGHAAGALVMITAGGYWGLFTGALVLAMANGLVEAACNPLVATLYPENKTVRLNQFHVWFPGGVVLGGLAAYGLDQVGVGSWQLKLGVILIPTAIYGVLMLGERFPRTEGVQAGVSVAESIRAILTTPLMWVMLLAMAMTASIELGPNRWVPAVMEAGGMAGILVLVWINGLMAILRYRAGPVVEQLQPVGVLLVSVLVAGVGLVWLSHAGPGLPTFAAATVFALGVCYLWPTMLGTVSERMPRTGAVGLGLMGAVGMATVGLVTSPAMGAVADRVASRELPVAETEAVLSDAISALSASEDPDAAAAAALVGRALEYLRVNPGELMVPETANALRAIQSSPAPDEVVGRAAAILAPADNYGGRVSFRWVTPLCGVLALIFGTLWAADRRRGGYRAERMAAEAV